MQRAAANSNHQPRSGSAELPAISPKTAPSGPRNTKTEQPSLSTKPDDYRHSELLKQFTNSRFFKVYRGNAERLKRNGLTLQPFAPKSRATTQHRKKRRVPKLFNDQAQAGFMPEDSKMTTDQQQSILANSIVSLTSIRQTRVKATNDVQTLQTRISILQAEETRALRAIAETQTKAETILNNRVESLNLRRSIDSVRRNQLKANIAKVRQRNESVCSESDYLSGSIMLARQSVNKSVQQKAQESSEFKRQMYKERARAKKRYFKSLVEARLQKDQIRSMETTGLKSVYESVCAQKSVEVRLIKAAKLVQELSLIKQKDQQARNLERVQAKLQERVRLTHELQQKSLSQIRALFEKPLFVKEVSSKKALTTVAFKHSAGVTGCDSGEVTDDQELIRFVNI